ncbi:MAG: hypothetical protein NTY09_06710 [bacterium]|nr:hypothetical protein [bacterium]
MGDLILTFQEFWKASIGSNIPEIVPSLLILIGIVWLFTVYFRKKFRFMPALAIARVTVLDSIGRLEVIILLAIGVLLVGINGIIPNTPEGRSMLDAYTGSEFIQNKLNDLSGTSAFSGTEEDTQQFIGGTGHLFDHGEDLNPDGSIDHPLSRAEEIQQEARNQTVQALIWQGAFLGGDVFVAIIGFILAMLVLPNDMNRGVILSILPKPITREEYVYGKAMGVWFIVAGCFLILSLELFGIRAIFDFINGTHTLDRRILMALALFPIKYATLILIVMGLTLRMPEIPAGIIGAMYYVCGHFSDKIYEIATAPLINPFIGFALKFSYWILPHLSPVTFSILDKNASLITTSGELWGWVWQIMIYNILLLKLLSWLFKRRSL